MKSKLRALRFIQDKSQYQLSRETGIPQSRISLLENRLVDVKPEEAIKLAEALNSSPEELFGEFFPEED